MRKALHRPLAGRVDRVGARQRGYIFEQAAERVGAVQRPLRAAQHFDAVDIGRIEIGRQDRAIGERGRRTIGRLVDIGRDGRPDPARVDAAQDQPRLPRLRLVERSARDAREEILRTVGVRLAAAGPP